jgi:hypothetical protein
VVGSALSSATAAPRAFTAGPRGVCGENPARVPLLDHCDGPVLGIVNGVDATAVLAVDGGDARAQSGDQLGGTPSAGCKMAVRATDMVLLRRNR